MNKKNKLLSSNYEEVRPRMRKSDHKIKSDLKQEIYFGYS